MSTRCIAFHSAPTFWGERREATSCRWRKRRLAFRASRLSPPSSRRHDESPVRELLRLAKRPSWMLAHDDSRSYASHMAYFNRALVLFNAAEIPTCLRKFCLLLFRSLDADYAPLLGRR